jgi:hypothetical protein
MCSLVVTVLLLPPAAAAAAVLPGLLQANACPDCSHAGVLQQPGISNHHSSTKGREQAVST